MLKQFFRNRKGLALLLAAVALAPSATRAAIIDSGILNVAVSVTGKDPQQYYTYSLGNSGSSLIFDVYGGATPPSSAPNSFLYLAGAEIGGTGSTKIAYSGGTLPLYPNAVDLAPGAVVDSSLAYTSPYLAILVQSGYGGAFPANGTTPGYAGFEFSSGGTEDYGYAEVTEKITTVNNPDGSSTSTSLLVINRIVYDDSGAPISDQTVGSIAPEPTSLFLAGLSLMGLGALFRFARGKQPLPTANCDWQLSHERVLPNGCK